MKRAWLEHRDEILAELRAMFQENCPLTFCQHGGMAIIQGIRDIIPRADKETLIVLPHPDSFMVDDQVFFVFYRRIGQKLLRGFQGYIVQSGQDFFIISFPQEIYKVQRRQHPRVSVPSPSFFAMSPRRSRRLLRGNVKNISKEGVLIEGDLAGLERGQEISPLTLTLYLANRQMEPVVSRARILRIEHKADEVWIASLQFWHQDSDQQAIERYLEWRAIETVT